MAALRRDARGLQPRGSGADDDDAAPLGGAGGRQADSPLWPSCGLCGFRQRPADMNLAPGKIVEARRPDVFGAAFARLGRPIGIGDQRPRHANEIAGAVGDGCFRLGGCRDAAERHYRPAGRREPHFLMDVEEMPASEMHVRRMVFQTEGEIALTIREIVERAWPHQRRCDPRRLIGVDAAFTPSSPGILRPMTKSAAADWRMASRPRARSECGSPASRRSRRRAGSTKARGFA